LEEEDFNLTDVDLSLIVAGSVLSKSRGKTALISNDIPMLKFWRYILYNQRDLREKLDFIVRENFNGFVKKPYFLKRHPFQSHKSLKKNN
jgi:hypothetical protein